MIKNVQLLLVGIDCIASESVLYFVETIKIFLEALPCPTPS